MRAAVLRGGTIEVRGTKDPAPGPGQILVRTLACGICASGIHFMDHPEEDDDDSGLSNYDPDADIVMGHEYCAELVATAQTRPRRGRSVRASSPFPLGDDGWSADHRSERRCPGRLRRVLLAVGADDPGGLDRPTK